MNTAIIKIKFLLGGLLFWFVPFLCSAQSEAVYMLNVSELSKFNLKPIDFYFDQALKHPQARFYAAVKDEKVNVLKTEQLKFLNYFKLIANYQYGRTGISTLVSSENVPVYVQGSNSAQSYYSVGAGISIPLDDVFSRRSKNRVVKAQIAQTEAQFEEFVLNYKISIIEYYANVQFNLQILQSKGRAALISRSQVLVGEQDFLSGKITIEDLSLKRRTLATAEGEYESVRKDLYMSMKRLEVLSGIDKVNKEKQSTEKTNINE